MGAERIAWHPGFASAVQLELLDYQGRLTFETEHELNRQPLRIDLLVVKKDASLTIDDGIAAFFRGHNVMEFKSERDSLNFDDLCKTVAYALLYKAYGDGGEPVDLDTSRSRSCAIASRPGSCGSWLRAATDASGAAREYTAWTGSSSRSSSWSLPRSTPSGTCGSQAWRAISESPS